MAPYVDFIAALFEPGNSPKTFEFTAPTPLPVTGWPSRYLPTGGGRNNHAVTFFVALVAVVSLVVVVFFDGLKFLVEQWSKREEYSHAYIIPAIALILAWQRRARLFEEPWIGSWFGWLVVMGGLLVGLLGELSTLYVLIQYAFLACLSGLCLAAFGWSGMRALWVALVYLIFMIPLPNFLYLPLSANLQLVSSALGVMLIRLFDISAYLEGNVIDLGVYQLQVVEACDGLRYLFPLMSFGFLCAALYRGTLKIRLLIFLSTVPIAILLNGVRIGVIGVLVEFWGIEQAEGFLHYVEGWAIFMLCVALLFAEMWLLARFSLGKKSLSQVFGIHAGAPVRALRLSLSRPLIVSVVFLGGCAFGLELLDNRTEVEQERAFLSEFPQKIDQRVARHLRVEPRVLDVLQLDDYLLAEFNKEQAHGINLYIAYYDSQRKGASIHSPYR